MRRICAKVLREGKGSVPLEVSQVARCFHAVSWLYVVREMFHQVKCERPQY